MEESFGRCRLTAVLRTNPLGSIYPLKGPGTSRNISGPSCIASVNPVRYDGPMSDILTLLIAERDKLDRAIAALQHRPPGRRSAGKTAQRRRKGMSAAARKAASERMKAYWEARRKQAARRRPK